MGLRIKCKYDTDSVWSTLYDCTGLVRLTLIVWELLILQKINFCDILSTFGGVFVKFSKKIFWEKPHCGQSISSSQTPFVHK